MAAKDKSVRWDPIVSTRLTNLNEDVTKMIAAREKQFKARDAKKAEITSTPKSEKHKLERLKSEWFDAVDDIEKLSKTIKWIRDEMSNTIDNADQPELFGKDPHPKAPKSIFEAKKPKDEAGQGKLALGDEGNDIDDE